MASQRCPRPNPWGCGCGALDGDDFAEMILDYPGGWTHCDYMGPYKRKAEMSESEKEMWQWKQGSSDIIVGFEDERGP